MFTQYYLQKSVDFQLGRDTTLIVANMFGISRPLVQSIWRKAKPFHAQGLPADLSSKRNLCGRRRVQVDLSQITAIPPERRSTIRAIAQELYCSSSTVHRFFQEGKIRHRSNTVKPYLRDENKKARIQFCISMLDALTLHDQSTFKEMYNIVHIDEKWFNTTSKVRTIYMLPDEEDPLMTVQNKNSIEKVMFLAALARPRYDHDGTCIFDGKIGVWPFVKKVGTSIYFDFFRTKIIA